MLKINKERLFGKFSRKRLIISFIQIYVILMLFAYFFADKLIFMPPPSSYKASDEIRMIDTGKEKIAVNYFNNTNSEYTVVFSHGNAEDIGDIRFIGAKYYARGFSVVLYDYPGYGLSSGKPTERSVYRAADAVMKYIKDDLHVPEEKIIVHGRSVGSGAACYIAEKYKVAGLILESPFASAFRVRTVVPIMPFDKFSNIARLKRISCPLLVMHGMKDDLIPIWHGKKLYDRATTLKMNYWVEGAGHNDLIDVAGADYWKAILGFISRLK